MDTSEKRFESDIETFLLSPAGGYVAGTQATYDKARALDMAALMAFLEKNATEGVGSFLQGLR